MAAKYKCLLANVLERDDDLIALVSSERAKIINIRNQMRKALLHYGIQQAHKDGIEPDEITAADVARLAFETVDDDGSGELSYTELQAGLPQFGIFLSKKEFHDVCRVVDPDQSQSLDMEEWMKFMSSTDDDLEGDDWKHALNAVKLRSKIKTALLEPVMKQFWEGMQSEGELDAPNMKNIVEDIFHELDVDGGGSLDFHELKTGLEQVSTPRPIRAPRPRADLICRLAVRVQHDVIISSDEFKKLVELVDRNSTGEFTAEMFHRACPGPCAVFAVFETEA